MSEFSSELRIKVKFGEHEFEAQGPTDAVHAHFELFKRLVSPQLMEDKPATKREPTPFDRMVAQKGPLMYLKIAAKPEDNMLLVLLAQKRFRRNEEVSGAEIMNGLRASGVRIPRGDYILAKHEQSGYIDSSGSGRRRRYRLTDAGVVRAEQIATELLSLAD